MRYANILRVFHFSYQVIITIFFAAAVMSSPSLFAAAIVDSPEVLPEYFRGIIIANSRQPLALFYADYISGENIRSDPWRNRNDVNYE